MNKSGFTMVEVIAVLVVLSIVSASAIGLYQRMGESEFTERLLLKSNLRYARQQAMNSTNRWSIAFAGGSYTLLKDGASGHRFPSLESGTHSPGISFSGPAQIEFEAQTGALTAAGAQTITFAAGSTVVVYPTGAIP
jgi:prepilin-type N-terminal cleavage/methylation domain-containing protein